MSARVLASSALAVACALGSVWAWRDEPGRDETEHGAADVAQLSGTTIDGATLFEAKGCAWCHRSDATEPFVEGFPDLSHVSTWGSTRRPGLDAAAYITESVRSPTAFLSPEWTDHGGPTSGMPSLVVSDAELEAIIDYLLH